MSPSLKLTCALLTAVALVLVSGCRCEPCDELEENKKIVLGAFDAINRGDLDSLDQYLADDYVRYCQSTPDVVVNSLDDMKQFLRRETETFPEFGMEIDFLVAEGDKVAFWARFTATQEGPMGPFPPSGKTMDLDFAGAHRIADGKIVETWVVWDNLVGLTQLGHFTPPAAETPPADEPQG